MVDIAPTFTRTFHRVFDQLFSRVQQVFRSAFKLVTGNSNTDVLAIYGQHNRSLCNGSKALFGNFGFLSDFSNQCIISPDVSLYSLFFDLLKTYSAILLSKSKPPRFLLPSVARTSNSPSLISMIVTSNVPPPKSYTRTVPFFFWLSP